MLLGPFNQKLVSLKKVVLLMIEGIRRDVTGLKTDVTGATTSDQQQPAGMRPRGLSDSFRIVKGLFPQKAPF